MTSSGGLHVASRLLWLFVVVFATCLAALSGFFLLSQAVRTSKNREWAGNVNAFVIGASYAVVLGASFGFYLKRRIAIRRKLAKISKAHKILGKGDVPKTVHDFISQEYARACLIAHESLPNDAQHEGYGKPESTLAGVNFRRALLDTIPEIDVMTRGVIRHQPLLMPHDRMLHHLRTIVKLFTRDEFGLTVVHYYDSAIQLARLSTKEPTEDEFRMGMDAAQAIKRLLYECRLEMSDGSVSELHEPPSMEL